MRITRILYLILLGIAYLFSLLYMPEFSVYLLLTLFLIPLFSCIAIHISGRKLKASIKVSAPVIYNEEQFSCTIHLENQSRFPLTCVKILLCTESVLFAQKTEAQYVAVVPAKGSVTISIPMTAEHCGKLIFSTKNISCLDPMHLFSHRYRQTITAECTIFPFVAPPSEIFQVYSKQKSKAFRSSNDPEEFLGIREYRDGDRLRSIHWKLSSRFDTPFIREYGVPVSEPISIAFFYGLSIDSPNAPNRLDGMLEAFSAIVQGVCQNEQPVTILLCHADRVATKTITDAKDFLPILQELLAEKPSSGAAACRHRFFLENCSADFCIVNQSGTNQMKALTFTAEQTDNGSGTIPIASGTAAQTVYQTLADMTGGVDHAG